MVHVLSALRPPTQPALRTPVSPAVTATLSGTASDTGAADFKALFTPKITSTTVTNPPATPTAPAAPPTAESFFGPNPWLANPTGIGPNGATYGYNPIYFASPDTAARVAQMSGGAVVESNQFTGNGGPFSQQQPNLMVQLPNGHLINPGLVASFYTHNYPQSYVDQLVANEFNS